MPLNKNAIIRYKFLDDLLSDRHHYYSIHDLTEKVNERLESIGCKPVVTRTLEKDLVDLQGDPFCISLERGKIGNISYIRYASRSFCIFSHQLSREEMSLLYEVLNTIGQFDGLPNFNWLDSLRNDLGLIKHKQVLSFSNNPYLKNTNILASLYKYVANECVLDITYHRFTDTAPESFIIHPYLLKEYNNRWYLVGLHQDNNKIYTLAIDRIVDYQDIPELKFRQHSGDINSHFENTIGITVYDDAKIEDIIFWVDDSIVPYVETKPFHSSQSCEGINEVEYRDKYEIPEGGKLFRIKCTLNIELEQALIRHFGDLIVLCPKKLRLSIIDKIDNLHNRYKKIEKK